jgi:ribosomal protein S12 methylthiotransferase accessory factor
VTGVPVGVAAGAAKRYTLGTHRVRAPEETWEWIAPLLPRVGVTRVADVTRLDVIGLPVWQAVRPASRNLSVSQGKAVTDVGAKVSAVMESVELWHAEDLSRVPGTVLSLREMRFANPVAESVLPWRPDSRRLDALPIPWVRAEPLRGDRTGWLPRDMVELDFTVPDGWRAMWFHRTSNGLASGNCREEAVLHGLCEVMERHALFLDYKMPEDHPERLPGGRRALDPDDLGGELAELVARVRAAGFRLALYDLTWSAGVPVMMADVCAPDLPNVWRGSGCHPAPEVALSRALTEAAQARLTYIAGARDDLEEMGAGVPPGRMFESFEEPEPVARLADRESLAGVAGVAVEEDLERVVGRLGEAGYEGYVVDLTREELGVPVVRVVVPGLREQPYA